jgi:PAS domain S-box-containing protein
MVGFSPASVLESLPQPGVLIAPDRSVVAADAGFSSVFGRRAGTEGVDIGALSENSEGNSALPDAVGAVLDGTSDGERITTRAPGGERVRAAVTPVEEDGERGALVLLDDEGEPPEGEPTADAERSDRGPRFTRAFERHTAPMLLIDPETGDIERANDAAVSFYGYDRGELTSMRIQEINSLSPEEVAAERERARRESRNHFKFEHEVASGEIRPVEVSSSPVEFEDGELLLSIVFDVSERERHKDAYEREQAFADSALDALPDIFYVTDGTGGLRRWNERLSEVTGYSDAEIEGMDATDFFAPAETEQIESLLGQAFEDGGVVTQDLTLETKSGERIPYEFTGKLVTLGGEPLGIAGIGRDITERRAREQDLRQLRRAIEATPHGIFLTDRSGRIEYVNPAFEAMTGYTEREVLGRTPRVLKSGEHDEAYYRDLWETVTGGDVWRAQIVNERKSGERYHAHQTIAPITEDDGTVSAFVSIQTDITGREERQQHFRVLGRVLRHNLKNDLSVVKSYAEQIGREGGHTAAVEKIVRKTEDILRTARKERQIARVLAEEVAPRELDVTAVIERALLDVRRDYPEATVRADLQDGVSAIGDPRFQSAIVELIENAIVHNDDPEVDVSVHEADDTVEILITDDGTGIPESEQKILETGTEIDPLYHGTGLGLWLVYWIVRRSGGSLSFSENDPHGSVVRITLEPERVVETTGYVVEK